MDNKALAEVDDILYLMSDEYKNRIPDNFKKLIRFNKDVFFDTGIKEFPNSFDNLRHETIIILGIIYEKYILNTDFDISMEKKEELKNNGLLFSKTNSSTISKSENLIVQNKDRMFYKLKMFLKRMKEILKKKIK